MAAALGAAALMLPQSPARTAAAAADFGPQAGPLQASNWGGYIAQGTFTSISGSWTQPHVTCNSTDDLFAPWLGLDGFGSRTVEQTGVETDCSSGTPVLSAWYEMYPAPPVQWSDPVAEGDHITASVVSKGIGRYTLTLTDDTRGWTEHTDQILIAKHVSAEAVIESPTQSYPSFSRLDFSGLTVNGLAVRLRQAAAVQQRRLHTGAAVRRIVLPHPRHQRLYAAAARQATAHHPLLSTAAPRPDPWRGPPRRRTMKRGGRARGRAPRRPLPAEGAPKMPSGTDGGATTLAWVVDHTAPAAEHPLEYGERPLEPLGPTGLLLDIRACGVCRTDLHLAEGDLAPRIRRCTPGHEIVGRVLATGPEAQGFAPDDRVGAAWLAGTCGTCRYCRAEPGEPLPELALHRLGRPRRLRTARRGRRPLRLPPARGAAGRGTGAAAVRGDHRLPGPGPRRAASRRPPRHLRIRCLRPPDRPARDRPGRHRARTHPCRGGTPTGPRPRGRLRGRGVRGAARAPRRGDPLRTGRRPGSRGTGRTRPRRHALRG
ncbi:hypothetical protein GCM10020000_03990 [Streptomyces olivoverticillatus]